LIVQQEELPSRLADPFVEIEWSLCMAISSGTEVEFEIGPGRWGVPWYRSITAGTETWRAP